MRKVLVCIVSALAVVLCTAAVQAAGVLAYSFEGSPPPDGFGNNGLTATQDTIGATEGINSLKMAMVAGAGFAGALTGNVPAPLGDPPGIEYILFDLTIVNPVTTGFADLFVNVFGASQPDYPGGQQFVNAQFRDTIGLVGLAAGAYLDQRIDLTDSHPHPLTFEDNMTFNEIFGTVGSGANDLIPTGFQFTIGKTGGAAGVPVTLYIDNVRMFVPEPASGMLLGLGAMAMGMVVRRRR